MPTDYKSIIEIQKRRDLTLINKMRIFICYEEIKKTYKNQEKGKVENPPHAYKSA